MKIIAIIAGLILLSACAYFSFFETLWFMAGGAWGLLNFYFIGQLLYGLLIEKPKNIFKIALLALFKFPILYGAALGLLYYYQDKISWAVLAGFSGSLVLNVLQNRLNKASHTHKKEAVV